MLNLWCNRSRPAKAPIIILVFWQNFKSRNQQNASIVSLRAPKIMIASSRPPFLTQNSRLITRQASQIWLKTRSRELETLISTSSLAIIVISLQAVAAAIISKILLVRQPQQAAVILLSHSFSLRYSKRPPLLKAEVVRSSSRVTQRKMVAQTNYWERSATSLRRNSLSSIPLLNLRLMDIRIVRLGSQK